MTTRLFPLALLAVALLAGCADDKTTESKPTAPPDKEVTEEHKHDHAAHDHDHHHGLFTNRPNTKLVPLPKEEGVFHFVVYGDRTGGVPAGLKVLEQAVADTNLLDPDLVMTVGDLIQGYNRTPEWLEQAKEFHAIMDDLKMPWYPVAGNHDVYWERRDRDKPEGEHEANYEKHFGPLWYSFKHKNAGFIVLYSDEGNPETGLKGFNRPDLQTMSQEQLEFLEQALDYNKGMDHVFVFLHHPRWLGNNYGDNWKQVHKRLAGAGNVSAVFAGHIHKMRYDGKQDGIEYFTLATTGGHLSADLPEMGYLHHYNVVTVRKESISLATIPVGAVIDPRKFTQAYLEDVNAARRVRPTQASGPLPMSVDGSVDAEYAVKLENPASRPLEITIVPDANAGWVIAPDHAHATVEPGKTATVKFHFRRDASAEESIDFQPPVLNTTIDYLGDKARITFPATRMPVGMALANVSADFFDSSVDRCLSLRGELDCVRVDTNAYDLPQGPFTLEAWVCPASHSSSQGVIAKTQSSEFAFFTFDGLPRFDVHLDGRYVTAEDNKELPIGEWTHLAGVFDGKMVKLYVNGKEAASVAGAGERTLNSLPLYLGADPTTDGSPTRPFHGKLDEVRLSRVVRYTEDFQPAKRFKTDADTELLYHFDNTAGPFVIDESEPHVAGMRLNGAKLENK